MKWQCKWRLVNPFAAHHPDRFGWPPVPDSKAIKQWSSECLILMSLLCCYGYHYSHHKTNLALLEQDIVSGNGINWAICKSAPWPTHNHASTQTVSFYRPDAFPATEPTASKHWKNLAWWCIWDLHNSLAVKINRIWKSKMAAGRHLENGKIVISLQPLH